MERYLAINDWVEEDILSLPPAETEYYEYKSGQTSSTQLKEKITTAASAFWNSGGGIFVVGLNGQGKIDVSIPEFIGRQTIRDWVDQILALVEPTGDYAVKTVNIASKSPNHLVLVISFRESLTGPHMAPDKKYYIRAGAHSGPASHYLVEAIRMRRGSQNPVLRGVLRFSPQKNKVVELVVLNLNDNPALDVELTFHPLPKVFAEHMADKFPLTIPVVNKEQSFTMDVSVWGLGNEIFGSSPVILNMTYYNITGKKFESSQALHLPRNVGPLHLGNSSDTLAALESLSKEVSQLRRIAETLLPSVVAKLNRDVDDSKM